MIELRRRYSEGVQSPSFSRLPKEYQEVEYIENTFRAVLLIPILNVEYFDSIKYKFYLSAEQTQQINTLYSTPSASGNNCMLLRSSYLGGVIRWFNYTSNSRQSLPLVKGNYYEEEIRYPIMISNTSQINLTIDSDKLYNENIVIFAANYGSGYIENGNGRLYYFTIEGKIDLVPCYRISDHKPGVYDIVNNVFYTNAGEGEFSYGPDVHYNIPFEYQQVEYLDNSSNPYAYLIIDKILKGFVGNIQAVVCLSQGVQQVAATPYRFAFGWYNGPQAVIKTDASPMLWHNTTTSSISAEIGVKYTVETKIMETLSNEYISDLYVDNKLASRSSKFNNENPLYILNSDVKTNSFIGKLYSFASDGTVNTHLIPCYRKEDDEAGMYDLVSGEFYTNAGTGTFKVGPLVI